MEHLQKVQDEALFSSDKLISSVLSSLESSTEPWAVPQLLCSLPVPSSPCWSSSLCNPPAANSILQAQTQLPVHSENHNDMQICLFLCLHWRWNVTLRKGMWFSLWQQSQRSYHLNTLRLHVATKILSAQMWKVETNTKIQCQFTHNLQN